DRDERPIGALAPRVHGARDELLSCPRLAEDRYRRRRGSNALDQIGKLPHRGIVADDSLVGSFLLGGGDGLADELRLADAQAGGERRLGLDDPDAADEGPIARAMIDDSKDALPADDSQVFAGDEAIGDDEIIGRMKADTQALADELMHRLLVALTDAHL